MIAMTFGEAEAAVHEFMHTITDAAIELVDQYPADTRPKLPIPPSCRDELLFMASAIAKSAKSRVLDTVDAASETIAQTMLVFGIVTVEEVRNVLQTVRDGVKS